MLKSQISYFFVVFVLLFGYILTNRPRLILNSTQTLVDNFIPLIPAFSVPYILYMPVLFGTLFFAIFNFGAREKLFLHRFILAQVIALLFFVLYPTTMLRVNIIGNDLFDNLVKYIYSVDQPFNLFPSTHVLHTTILTQYWIKTTKNNLIKLIPAIVGGLICISTVLVKQHYAVDILGGLVIFGFVTFVIKNKE